MEGDGFNEVTQGASVDQCVHNWHAALPNNLKSMFLKFDETFIFLLLFVDMDLFCPV